jgi:hypothetical protein
MPIALPTSRSARHADDFGDLVASVALCSFREFPGSRSRVGAAGTGCLPLLRRRLQRRLQGLAPRHGLGRGRGRPQPGE